MKKVKNGTRLSDTLETLESFRKVSARLEDLVGHMEDHFGNMSFLEMFEEELREEKPYPADGWLRITGYNTDIGWSFEEIVAGWRNVYENRGEEYEDDDMLREMAKGFHRLGDMFMEEANKKE